MAYNNIADIGLLAPADSNIEIDNKCLILTLDNILCFMSDIGISNYNKGETLFSIASSYIENEGEISDVVINENMCPLNSIVIPVYLAENNNYNIVPLLISGNGNCIIDGNGNISDGRLMLNGINCNIDDRYYNNELKNNYPQETSPREYNITGE